MSERARLIDSKGKDYGAHYPLPVMNLTPAVPAQWDSFALTQPDPAPNQDQYVFSLRGITVATVTLTYADATKGKLLSGVVTVPV